MLRKPQCDFGWDWNAALMPMGIYGDLYLDTDTALVTGDTLIHQAHHDGQVSLTITQQIKTGRVAVASASICGVTAIGHCTADAVSLRLI